LVGIVPGLTIGPYLGTAVRSVLGDATPYYSLAVWHGLNVPLVMSLVALVGGALLYRFLLRYLENADGPPLIRHLVGPRIFERIVLLLSVRWAKTAERLMGTRRLQPQLALLVGV